MQDIWLSQKADEIQAFADSHDMRNFYNAVWAVYGPIASGSAPLLLTDKEKILNHWAEHFADIFNRPSSINDEAINCLPQVKINDSLVDPRQYLRLKRPLNCSRAPGADSIPAEIYKSGGPKLIKRLTEMFCEMWKQKRIPQDFKDASIIHLYKRRNSPIL